MQKFKTLDDAVRLAEYAHKHQLDKAGLPYIDHPKRVLAAVQGRGAMPYVQIAAVLHDVPEDTAFSHDVLLALGFSEAVVVLTRLLDRGYSKDVAYQAARDNHSVACTPDEFYYLNIRRNHDALMIKDEDIADNTKEWRLNYFTDEKRDYLENKYAKAMKMLHPVPVF
jgi:(p)ppGpp synthase/HD superfamily hydrolase